MARYFVSDLHLGHGEVLEYTGRPFASVAEMNDRLVDGWNAVVDDGDEVVFVGDLAVPSEPTTVRRWLRRLAGDVIFVAGDHDDGVRRTRAVDARAAYQFAADGYKFQCAHDPDEVPVDRGARADRDGWLVHGHHHDIRVDEYPFVDPDARRVNVSVELLGYEPLPVEELIGYLDRRERLRRRPE